MSLQIENVTKKFGDHIAVNQLNLQIPQGEIFGLLGANGAGKTTTIRMILSLISPTEGNITWKGEKVDFAASQRIGYLPEERGLYQKLTVKEQLIYLGRLRGMKKEEILHEMNIWLERFRVPEYLNKKVEELSKGNQQKIQFIASVLHKPELLFLDEPFSGLDPVNVELLKEAVQGLAQKGTTLVFSSHRMEHVEELCEHLCILHKGSPVVHGKLKEIKRSFGKNNVLLHTEVDLPELANIPGVTKVKKIVQGYQVQIADYQVSQKVLAYATSQGFVSHFSLEEPSLNDIFIEKVGVVYE